MTPWKIPVLVASIAVPLVAGFLIAGPALGTALGALAVATIIVVSARQRPRDPIGSPPRDDGRRVLVVITEAVDVPADVERLIAAGDLDGAGTHVLVLSPARIHFLDRWASDIEGSRREAQHRLVVTVAALAKAGVDAEARVGDEDVVQAIDDLLGTYEAGDVVLVSGDLEAAAKAEEAADELEERLRAEFHHLVLG